MFSFFKRNEASDLHLFKLLGIFLLLGVGCADSSHEKKGVFKAQYHARSEACTNLELSTERLNTQQLIFFVKCFNTQHQFDDLEAFLDQSSQIHVQNFLDLFTDDFLNNQENFYFVYKKIQTLYHDGSLTQLFSTLSKLTENKHLFSLLRLQHQRPMLKVHSEALFFKTAFLLAREWNLDHVSLGLDSVLLLLKSKEWNEALKKILEKNLQWSSFQLSKQQLEQAVGLVQRWTYYFLKREDPFLSPFSEKLAQHVAFLKFMLLSFPLDFLEDLPQLKKPIAFLEENLGDPISFFIEQMLDRVKRQESVQDFLLRDQKVAMVALRQVWDAPVEQAQGVERTLNALGRLTLFQFNSKTNASVSSFGALDPTLDALKKIMSNDQGKELLQSTLQWFFDTMQSEASPFEHHNLTALRKLAEDQGLESFGSLLLKLKNFELPWKKLILFLMRPRAELHESSIFSSLFLNVTFDLGNNQGELMKALDGLFTDSNPFLIELLEFFQKSLLRGDAQPFVQGVQRCFQSEEIFHKLMDSILHFIQQPKFEDFLILSSTMGQNGALLELTEAFLKIFEPLILRMEKAKSALLVPQSQTIPRLRYHNASTQLIDFEPQEESLPPWKAACLRVQIAQPIMSLEPDAFKTQLKDLLECLDQGTDGNFETLKSWFDNNGAKLFTQDLRNAFFGAQKVKDTLWYQIPGVAGGLKNVLDSIKKHAHLSFSFPFPVEELKAKFTQLLPKFSDLEKSLKDHLTPEKIDEGFTSLEEILKILNNPLTAHGNTTSLIFPKALMRLKPELIEEIKKVEYRLVSNDLADSSLKEKDLYAEYRAGEILSEFLESKNTWEVIDQQLRFSWDRKSIFKQMDYLFEKIASKPAQNLDGSSAQKVAESALSFFRAFATKNRATPLVSLKSPLRSLDTERGFLEPSQFFKNLPAAGVSKSFYSQENFSPDFLFWWFYERATDYRTIQYFYPGESSPRVKIVNTLDLFDLVVFETDFEGLLGRSYLDQQQQGGESFLNYLGTNLQKIAGLERNHLPKMVRKNLVLDFLKELALAWGDEEPKLWPQEIHKLYPRDSQQRPKTLLEAVKGILKRGSMNEDYESLVRIFGLPEVKERTSLPGKIYGFIKGWMPAQILEVQKRLYNIEQVRKVLLENAPGSREGYQGGLEVLRNLFFEIYISSPESTRLGDDASESNHLRIVLHSVRAGILRQIGSMLARIPPSDTQGLQIASSIFSTVIQFSKDSSSHEILQAFFKAPEQQKSERLVWKLMEPLFNVLDGKTNPQPADLKVINDLQILADELESHFKKFREAHSEELPDTFDSKITERLTLLKSASLREIDDFRRFFQEFNFSLKIPRQYYKRFKNLEEQTPKARLQSLGLKIMALLGELQEDFHSPANELYGKMNQFVLHFIRSELEEKDQFNTWIPLLLSGLTSNALATPFEQVYPFYQLNYSNQSDQLRRVLVDQLNFALGAKTSEGFFLNTLLEITKEFKDFPWPPIKLEPSIIKDWSTLFSHPNFELAVKSMSQWFGQVECVQLFQELLEVSNQVNWTSEQSRGQIKGILDLFQSALVSAHRK